MKKIIYWSPVLSNIATRKAVFDSAVSLKKYSKEYDVTLINSIGEFDDFKENKFYIKIKDFYKKKKYYGGSGFWKTRFSYIRIFLNNFFILKNYLKNEKPDFIIIHLVTSLPLMLLILFKFETKFILRISGLPQMKILRFLLWKLAFKKIYFTTCPTETTKNFIDNLNLTNKNKVITLPDPILKISDFINAKKQNNIHIENYFLAAGRLTKQKNFLFLLKTFKKLYENKIITEKLIILGEGELYDELKNYIYKNNLDNKIFLLGYKKNSYKYFYSAKAFILSSLWEDPGFVLIEAAFCRSTLISSNCPNGPFEFFNNKNNGFMFESNNEKSLINSIIKFNKSDKNKLKEKKLNALLETRKYSMFNHFKILNQLLIK